MSNWRIVGISRESGEAETIYAGDDYSNVSDMMLNPDEGSADYAHMSLYEDGRLIESHPQPRPRPGQGSPDLGWVVLVIIVLVVLYILIH